MTKGFTVVRISPLSYKLTKFDADIGADSHSILTYADLDTATKKGVEYINEPEWADITNDCTIAAHRFISDSEYVYPMMMYRGKIARGFDIKVKCGRIYKRVSD